jgi:hypothetical protein
VVVEILVVSGMRLRSGARRRETVSMDRFDLGRDFVSVIHDEQWREGEGQRVSRTGELAGVNGRANTAGGGAEGMAGGADTSDAGRLFAPPDFPWRARRDLVSGCTENQLLVQVRNSRSIGA